MGLLDYLICGHPGLLVMERRLDLTIEWTGEWTNVRSTGPVWLGFVLPSPIWELEIGSGTSPYKTHLDLARLGSRSLYVIVLIGMIDRGDLEYLWVGTTDVWIDLGGPAGNRQERFSWGSVCRVVLFACSTGYLRLQGEADLIRLFLCYLLFCFV